MFTRIYEEQLTYSENSYKITKVFARNLSELEIGKQFEKAMFNCAGRNYWHLKHEKADKLVLVLIAEEYVAEDKSEPSLTGHYYLFDEKEYLNVKENIVDIMDSSRIIPNLHNMKWSSVNEFSFREKPNSEETIEYFFKDETVENLWDLNYLAERIENYKLADSYDERVIDVVYCGHMTREEYYPIHWLYPSYFEKPTAEEMWFWLRYTGFSPNSEFAQGLLDSTDRYNSVIHEWINS